MREHTMQQTNEYSFVDAVLRTAFLSMLTLFALYSAVWMAQDIFPGWVFSKKARLCLHVSIIFTAALYEIGIRALPRMFRNLCRLCVPVVYAVTAFRYMKAHQTDLEDGACAMAMQFLEKWNKHLGTFFSIWRGKDELLGMAFAFWTLVILLCLLLLALVLGRYEILLLFPMAVFAAELLVGYIPQWKGMALFFTALLFVHADGGNGIKTVLRVHVDKKRRYTQLWYQPMLPVFCLAGAVAFILFCSSKLSDATAQRWMDAAPAVQKFQKKTEQGILDAWNGFFTPRQETVRNQAPYYTGKEMLKVTASRCPAEDVLLKGFCGTDYQNGSWVCDRQKFADACAREGYGEEEAAGELFLKQYDMLSQGAERITMRYAFGGSVLTVNVGENETTEYTVEHTGIRSKYAFLPYAVDYEEGRGKEYLVSDATVQKSWRQKTFSYSGWNHFTGSVELDSHLQEGEGSFFSWYDVFVKKTYLDTPDQVPTVDDYLGAMQDLQEEMERLASSVYGSEPEELHGAFSERDMAAGRNWMSLLALQQEADYIDDISDSGQEYPQAASLITFWRNRNRLETAIVLSETLKKYQNYSLDLQPLPQGEDPVDYFLMHSHEGYCVHFASAAALLLRKMGVPARYASGYVVRAGEFNRNGDVYEASVKDSSAHAWVEIYLEQVGWVPVDVTPGAERQAVQHADAQETTSAGRQETEADTEADDTKTDDTDADETETDADDTQADTEDEKNKEAGGGMRLEEEGKWVWQRYSLVWVLGAVLFAALAVYGAYRQAVRLYQLIPNQEIEAGKYSQAVRRINRRIYRRLCVRSRIARRNLSDAQYEQMLNSTYQQISMEDWTRYMQAAKAAAFAQNEVMQAEAEFCWHIYQTVLHKRHEKY